MKTKLKLLSSLFLFFVLSCKFDPVPHSGSNDNRNGTGILYVADSVENSIFIYDNLNSLNGDITATRTLTGTNTLINNPSAIAVDTTRDYLYVSDTTDQKILMFSPASSRDGNVAPTKTFTNLKRAGSFFYDSTNDRLYASDLTDQAIKVWDSISTLSSGAGPTRTLELAYQPSSFFVDRGRNLLYVGDPASASIKVYENAATLTTSSSHSTLGPSSILSETRSFTNDTNDFVNINGMAINTDNNILFISESNYKSIEVFNTASNLSGAEESAHRLIGDATTLNVNQTQVSFNSNTLYVLKDESHLLIWNNGNTVEGDVAPTRSLNFSDASRISAFTFDFTD